jgi:hypothetical protein
MTLVSARTGVRPTQRQAAPAQQQQTADPSWFDAAPGVMPGRAAADPMQQQQTNGAQPMGFTPAAQVTRHSAAAASGARAPADTAAAAAMPPVAPAAAPMQALRDAGSHTKDTDELIQQKRHVGGRHSPLACSSSSSKWGCQNRLRPAQRARQLRPQQQLHEH